MTQEAKATLPEDIFAGGGEMGALMRSLDWSKTPMGAVETWSQSLKTAVQLILGSRYSMFVWWGQHLTKFYNDAYIPILGERHPQALGLPASQVWAEIWDTLGPQTEAVLHQGQSTWNHELLLIMERNGYPEETYFTFSYSPVANDDGGIGGVFCACTEDTGRVLSERRLQTLRDLGTETVTAKAVEAACEISASVLTRNGYDIPFALFYILDRDRSQAHLASTTRLATGTIASPEAIDLSSAEALDGWQLAQVLETGESKTINNLQSRFEPLPGGAWSDAPQQAVVLPLARSEELFGFLIVGVSPLRLFDDDYKGFFDLMAGQVTSAIANARTYEEERKRAEALAELDRAKTTFFSNVSHEFRTPLTLILNPLEELSTSLDERLQSDEREQFQMMQRNGLRLQKLVNTLLDFSRIEAGRIQAAYEPTDLASFTAELASVFRSTIERAGMELEIECETLPEPVYVDREMWEKIVLNLMSNAFKFTFTGKVAVRLRSVGDRIKLSVRDTGVGIPAAELPRLFERFHRVSGTRSRTYEGSGIGLALVQELVKLHQGAIEVESVEGEGTCFKVSIPKGTKHLPQDRIGTPRTLASTALGANVYLEEAQRWLPQSAEGLETRYIASLQDSPLSSLSSEGHSREARILLVDDNADMRDYVKRLLVAQQYEVEAVSDGLEALSAIRQQMPDLVLTDVMMPNLDGFGLLQALRSEPQTQEIPIILLSARAGEEARIEGLTAGADDYLIKPFSARELLARVEASLKLAQLRREAEAALRESEEKYRTLFESIDEGFCIVEMIFDDANQPIDYRFLSVNPAFNQQTGKENALGKTVREIAPQHEDYWFEIYGNVALTGESIRFENRAEEFQRWYEVHAFRVGAPDLRRVAIVFNDITNRKQTEELLRRSEEMFSALVENAPFGVYFIDSNFRLRAINSGSRAVFSNISPLIDRDFAEILRILWPEPFATEAIARFRHTLATGESYIAPTVIEERQNIEKIESYDWQIHRITLPDGSYGVVCYFYDLTEIKRAEEIVRRAAERDAFLVMLTDALRPLADPVEVQATASRVLGEYLGANRVAYFEIRGADYFVDRDYVNGVAPLAGGYSIDSFGPQLLAAFRAGHTVSESNVKANPNLSVTQREAFAAIQIGAYIGVPLLKNGEFVAGLAVHSSEARVWTQDEIALAEEVAERTWAAVERARAEAEVAADLQDTQLLRELGARLATEGNIQTLYEEILTAAIALTRADAGTVQIFDEATQELVLLATHGFDRDMTEHFYRINASSNTSCGIALRRGDRTFVDFDVPPSEDPNLELRMHVEAGYLSAQSTPLITRAGKPIGMISTHWRECRRPSDRELRFLDLLARQAADSIEQQQTKAALRDSEEQFRNMADNAPFMVWVTDSTGYCTYLSKSWYDFTGQTEESGLGFGWFNRTHPEDLAVAEQMFLDALSRQEAFWLEYRLQRKDGEYIWALDAASPWFGGDGQFKGYVGFVIDISDRKQTEIQLEQTASKLTERNQELDRFVYTVSHDLKAPLRAIANLSQWISDDLEGQLEAENQHQLELLRTRVYRMESLIEGLLAYSRVGRTEVATETVDVGKLIHEVLDSLMPPPGFTISVQPQMPTINTKRLLLSQVFSNLISNAIKHCDRPNGRIQIFVRHGAQNYEFSVVDNGPGIAPENHERVFGIFQTLKGRDTKESTGIGLSIVKKIVETEGGSIVLESDLGKGATFRFTWHSG